MPVAVVTGSNKGIGLGVVRGLCKKFSGDVFLTARDEQRGKDAVALLESEGLNPKFHLFDLADRKTVEDLRDFMLERYGGIDVLVNNAGIAISSSSGLTFPEQAEQTLATNYWDNSTACNILFPILKPGARVVNVSSSMGFLGHLVNSQGIIDHPGDPKKANSLKENLASPELTREQLDAMMAEFVDTAKEDTCLAHGWPKSSYVVSKIGWSALSRIQQRELEEDAREDIVVNHVHPGWVATDLGGAKAALTIDRGAEAPLYAALLPPRTEVRGAYIWHDCQLVDWVNGPYPPFT